MKKVIIIIISFLTLQSCQTAQDALTLKKKNSGDEFLVEKKSPLVMPPDYGKLPSPSNNQENKKQNSDDTIENLISSDKKILNTKKENNSETSSIEKIILEKIK
tara:strand:+ start:1421 stop:1732 length:312 start_codon:yes stop_codon:yes gene_type:complete